MLGGFFGSSGSWKDRLSDAVIETPDKKRHEFQYGDLEKEINKKTSKYRFGGVDGTYVQDFGLGEVSFPMTIYFSGANHDKDANSFEKSASKKGVCILEHPIYGVKNVIIESIKRQDNLKTAGNQTVFILTMTETILFKIPQIEPDNGLGLTKALENLADSVSTAFQNSFLGKTAQALANAADRITAIVNDIVSAVEFISSTVDGITSSIYSLQRYINGNMTNLLQAPFTLADSIGNLIDAPAEAISSVENKFNMFKDMYNTAMTFQGGIDSSKNSNDKKNQCAEKMLVASRVMGATCKSLQFTKVDSIGFKTKKDATVHAQKIIDFYYEVQEALDSLQENTENDSLENSFVIDSQVVYNLKNVVALTVQNLVSIAYTLKQERIIYTDREYNIFELCYKLYGTSEEETLQSFIDANELIGTELLTIPQNREIKYYV